MKFVLSVFVVSSFLFAQNHYEIDSPKVTTGRVCKLDLIAMDNSNLIEDVEDRGRVADPNRSTRRGERDCFIEALDQLKNGNLTRVQEILLALSFFDALDSLNAGDLDRVRTLLEELV